MDDLGKSNERRGARRVPLSVEAPSVLHDAMKNARNGFVVHGRGQPLSDMTWTQFCSAEASRRVQTGSGRRSGIGSPRRQRETAYQRTNNSGQRDRIERWGDHVTVGMHQTPVALS